MPPLARSSSQHKASCRFCVKAFKWFPVLFILVIIMWSYYAFVIQLCFLTIESAVKQLIYLGIYHVLFILFIWAYFQTVFAKKAYVPDKFKLPEGELDRLTHAEDEAMQNAILEQFCQDLPIYTRTGGGVVRYCEKCRLAKPDRTHHCSVCGRCILKMDHHCPWVNNCVCFTNYKYFILFLSYALLYSVFVACTSMEYFIQFWEGHQTSMDSVPNAEQGTGRFHILFLFFVAVMFAISLASLFFYHVYLLSVNRTTLEAFRAPTFHSGEDNHGFDIGKYKNFKQVFGENPKLWFLPIFTTTGDGVCYPLRSQPPPGSYQTMENSQTSMGDGFSFEKRHTEEDREALLDGLTDS